MTAGGTEWVGGTWASVTDLGGDGNILDLAWITVRVLPVILYCMVLQDWGKMNKRYKGNFLFCI